ncbi:MAG: hypothetical protein JWO22_80 [Frankiales bacterium]|nr:hypothetical protein [Frankiales bacterium]
MTSPLARVLAVSAVAAGALALGAGPASADTTRCVGATSTPGAFACYTSPRTDHIGLDKAQVATVPVVCYGLGCTSTELTAYVPGDKVGGRFTAVSYLGRTYTVYRPTGEQPYIIASGGAFTPAEQLQVLLLSAALDATAS